MALVAGRGAKAKGATGERELATLLRGFALQVGVTLELFRNLEQTRGGGHDLKGLEDEYKLAVEVKRRETVNVDAWWHQACRQATVVNCDPVLAWRQNRRPWAFRVRAWVYPCNAKPLDIDMDVAAFRTWFQARLKQHAVLSQE